MITNKVFEKVAIELKNYSYCFFNIDCSSNKLSNYSYNVSVSYNSKFSENIVFIVRNQLNRIMDHIEINIEDLSFAEKRLKEEVY